MKINKELLKGSTSIIILGLLKEKPMYGYEMIKELEEKSKGVFLFKEGTLYPILHSLEKEGLIEAFWSESDTGRKRKYYKITDLGKIYAKEKKEEWVTYREAVNNFLWEAVL